jgi:hypothetical protein
LHKKGPQLVNHGLFYQHRLETVNQTEIPEFKPQEKVKAHENIKEG